MTPPHQNDLQAASTQQWESIYRQVPLAQVPQHFANIRNSPFTLEYLSTILRLCPLNGRTLETGTGSGYSAIWLSLRGVKAQGIDLSPHLVERSKHINSLLEGTARFSTGDLFEVFAEHKASNQTRYDVIHHQGVLEHFNVPQIRAALAQQVASAQRVVFSVPSVYYPFEPEFGDERLLPLEEWQHILEPFDVEELRYHGDSQHGEKEHVLVVLRGQEVTPELRAMMTVAAEPFPQGVSAIVHTRNESARIRECLESLQSWVDEIIVCDMESEDDTVAIAESMGAQVLHHPRIPNFDRARNVSSMRAKYRWIFFLDADERTPPPLGQALRHIAKQQSALTPEDEGYIAGLLVPFRHHFSGQWLRCLYPGYTAPRLLRNGRFVFNARLHSGAKVEGPVAHFPADDPHRAIVHFSYDSLSHYLTKLNGYTDGESLNLYRDGAPFHWQNAVREFVRDFQMYYQGMNAVQDGVHGFLYSFLSGFYRFEQHAKLYERRFQGGQLTDGEKAVPASLVEMLEFALQVAQDKPLLAPRPIQVLQNINPDNYRDQNKPESWVHFERPDLVWSGPVLDPSGYGEESRNFVFGLDHIGEDLSVQVLPWSHDEVDMPEADRTRLMSMVDSPVRLGFTHIVHNLAPGIQRHPQAGIAIGRTMFETDRLPQDWVRACNRMDYVWVPSEFHRQSFADAGVPKHKLAIIPEAIDVDAYQMASSPESLNTAIAELPSQERQFLDSLRAEQAYGKHFFLSVFDWTRHKGWDALLRGFIEAFEGREDVVLLLKVWSTMGYGAQGIQQQAARWAQEELGYDLLADSRIRFVSQRLSRPGLCALYATADAFVLPSRGEGWGRPYMEAMACGKPVIGTNWSGNTTFMTAENSYLLNCEVRDVPEIGWREIPTYRGHRWAEPDHTHLVQLLREVESDRTGATERGEVAKAEVLAKYNQEAVAKVVVAELNRVGVLGKTTTVDEANCEKNSVANEKEGPTDTSTEVSSVAVKWEGALFNWHSLAHVNRELCLGLLNPATDPKDALDVEFSFLPTEPSQFDPAVDSRFGALAQRSFAPLSKPAQVHLRHYFPPRLDKPSDGRFVLIQPWEYGYLPKEWIEPIKQNVDQVWCHTKYLERVYLDSGIPQEKLRLVPLGIDPEVFRPDVPPYVFTNEAGAHVLRDKVLQDSAAQNSSSNNPKKKPFTFLFVGGSIHRKGIDILLEAYRRAFTALDDVCLVIKDTGTSTVYRDAHSRDSILERINDPQHPAMVYLDHEMESPQLAGLFASSDCYVQPYRGEGFCLPVLEAMACGTPVVVPKGGPTDDFVDESVGWLLEAEHKPFHVDDAGFGHVGPWECTGPTWQFEVDPDALARLMRHIALDSTEQRAEVRQKGQAAALRAHREWTWQQAAEKARLALAEFADGGTLESFFTSDFIEFNDEEDNGLKSVPHIHHESLATKLEVAMQSEVGRDKPTISLCMIVKNEERVLGDCLTSASQWFDEVIIVDTGSNDRTVAIAEEHGAKVLHFPWCDDFSAARNISLEHATGDWLFWMDADDTLPPECGRELRRLAELAEDRVSGFIVPVHIPPASGENGFTIVDHVKLFRNHPGHRFEGRIHEQILGPIHRAGGTIERSSAYVVHSGYDYSPAGQVHKRERDLRILEKDLADRPDHPFVLFNIGMTAYHMKDYDKAIPTLLRCLEVSGPQESTVRKIYAMLAGCHLEKGNLLGAREWLEKGLSRFPKDPELLFRGGIIYREVGELERAAGSYLKLLGERETGHIDSLDVTMTGFKAHHNLALIFLDMGRPEAAEHHFKQAVADNRSFVPSWGGLRESLAMQQKWSEVKNAEEILLQLSSAYSPS